MSAAVTAVEFIASLPLDVVRAIASTDSCATLEARYPDWPCAALRAAARARVG